MLRNELCHGATALSAKDCEMAARGICTWNAEVDRNPIAVALIGKSGPRPNGEPGTGGVNAWGVPARPALLVRP